LETGANFETLENVFGKILRTPSREILEKLGKLKILGKTLKKRAFLLFFMGKPIFYTFLLIFNRF
jgi:hypothetical protein